MEKTGLIFFPAFDWAISPTHPEREERLLYTRDQIFEEGVMDLPQIKEFAPRLATLHDIARTHFCVPRVQSQVTEAHLIAAGSTLQMGDSLVNKEIKNGFALVRPPGHHAMRVVHGNRGFCSINNEAILVEYLRRRHGIKRVAIVDSDAHHGDGTQDIFYHDPDVLFISFHQDGRTIFPGTGFIHELGGPGAYARTLNVPLPPGTSDETFLYVVDNLILPVLNDFKPDIIINSAGQDNHYTDPLGSMRFTARAYADFTSKLKPDLAVLEGGYAIESALPYVNLAIILALAGEDYSYVMEPDYWPGRFKENQDRMAQVKKMVDKLLETWENKNKADIQKIFGNGKYYQKKKFIYYDTDYIEEEQFEKVRVCPDCPGYIIIESRGDRGYKQPVRIFAVSVPFQACNACQNEAYEVYEEAKSKKDFDYIYMQDKSTDTCISFDKKKGQEWVTEG
ncbi:Acetoin utilization deacetylase AcuC [Desulfotomaculum arcticum]|uniref:Acetoin utilization deacetylase AcuC n=1 Tax=Desulfotruncus arcticus DSM 17038 TaxID=1121424 RepID=A0A1I2S113_9FIRM|nr:histone deacetylase [Desulfotruncus arcticus]SFG46564.1 Acetoin utilization deacetylase AcuC [Desulfotomaculum arcticum] [Desulfotruncus arcticus DSM 17038]